VRLIGRAAVVCPRGCGPLACESLPMLEIGCMLDIGLPLPFDPCRRLRHGREAKGCTSRSRHAELLILCARIGFNP